MATLEQRKWHLDRSIPFALVVAIIGQTLVGTWWISSFESRTVNRLENLETRQKVMDQIPEKLARQESQIETVLVMLKDLKVDFRELNRKDKK
ncbi:MAG: hypothetical protein WC100_02600 [Sterolibacterium sp.]